MSHNDVRDNPTSPSPSRNDPVLDILALAIITSATVALVVFGNATAAILVAAGTVIGGSFEVWRRSRRS